MNNTILTNEEFRNIMMNILLSFDRFCTDKGLKYSLCGGTLLGAVRHKGFIPWDDDIDVMMPRQDYEKFVKYFNEYYSDYKCITCADTKDFNCSKTFAKVHDINTLVIEDGRDNKDRYGAFIDVFPIDGMSSSLFVFRIHLFIYRQIESIIRICSIDNSLLKSASTRIKKWIGKSIGRKGLSGINNKVLSFYSFSKSKYAGIICGVYGEKDRFKREVFEEYCKKEFEGYEFSAIANFDIYLSQLYGDYMRLPPEDKRINHKITAFRIS